MKTYSQVEGMLYGHYRKKKRISSFESKLVRTINRIEGLRRDIKECNTDLGETMKGIDYSRDSSGSNSISSSIERELDKAVDNILKEITYNIKDKYRTMAKINDLKKSIDDTEILLEKLTKEELEIVELKYSDKLNDREVSESLFMARSTLQRKKEKVIQFIIDELKSGQKVGR